MLDLAKSDVIRAPWKGDWRGEGEDGDRFKGLI